MTISYKWDIATPLGQSVRILAFKVAAEYIKTITRLLSSCLQLERSTDNQLIINIEFIIYYYPIQNKHFYDLFKINMEVQLKTNFIWKVSTLK
jgi:hypothetical protein